ncbi:MAG: class I SAM-dependent methyltransferase [Lentisphaeria bacterium]|nr:class I SAM-dependent methyltransferase [Lentisphaeria bacterium]NQZ67431.1 class I SAM-dependent methyltransferase [Lentisphaeria bacterium]
MSSSEDNRNYWDEIASDYQDQTRISCEDYHYGPLVPGDSHYHLLPESLENLDCLELGCGAAQNSIYLASKGANCTALDVSEKQLKAAQSLANDRKLKLNTIQAGIDEFAFEDTYDLIHSSFGLPFADDPELVIEKAAMSLKPGGSLLLSLAHPVFAGEWLEVDEEGEGLFLHDYFNPPADVRFTEDDTVMVRSRAWPISDYVSWVFDANLSLEALIEPQALPVPIMEEDEIKHIIPYDSKIWRQLYSQISKVPVVVIIKANKPLD